MLHVAPHTFKRNYLIYFVFMRKFDLLGEKSDFIMSVVLVWKGTRNKLLDIVSETYLE